jgi:hypothetical protein
MIGPTTQDAAVSAPANSGGYPSSRIALISSAPSPPASATALPDIPENTSEPTTFTWPSPPRRWPKKAEAKP